MTEKFKLAANVLLKRRLNNLVRIDNNLEIDRSYITCAEYQLFIDEMRQQGKNCQPDHWTSERFPTGYAKKPITGVRASDAEEFCQWLTQKESLFGFRYRLPSLAETTAILVTTEDIGCWCKDKNTLVISGITSQQWKDWQQKFPEYLIFRDKFSLKHNLNHFLNLDLNRNLDFNNFLNDFLNRNLNLDLNLDLYCVFNRDLHCVINRNLYRNVDRVLSRILNRVLNRVLDLNLDLYLDPNFDLNFDFDLNLNLNHFLNRNFDRNLYFYRNLDLDFNLDFYRNLDPKINTGQTSNLLLLYFPLMFIVVIYHILKTLYKEADQNITIQQSFNLSSQACEAISQKHAQKRDEIYPLYVYLVLIDERRKGNIPAWEGIRIVREREEID